MNLKTNIILSYILLMLCSFSYGQIEKYNYKRELKNITDQWHKVVLPNEIFGKVSSDISDIRIFGITANNDTIEAPYILRLASEKISSKDIDFNLINKSQNEKGYYFTFEIPSENLINEIKLDFNDQNFDWQLKLEGSQNQQKWFTIVDDYRILSIKNGLTDYKFTKIFFPKSKYRFFRILIKNKKKPNLKTAKIALHEITKGEFIDYKIIATKIDKKKQNKKTVIDIDLKSTIPVSYLKICIQDTIDYYRSVTIKYLTDSFNTEQGWKYNYRILTSGTLNSIEKNEFKFNSTILQKLKIVINNHDNEPLTIDSFKVKGNVHELAVRFSEPATYYLTYGNSKIGKPHYDINRFTDKIPDTLTAVELGIEQKIKKEDLSETNTLFKNKIWLWAIMVIIILLLGLFTVKMIREK